VSVRFGAFIGQLVPYPELRDDFRFAESLGLEVGWVADHFAIPRVPDMLILEAWTTLAALAADTERIRLGTLVTNVATRNPALLAKQALTVDQISNGRLDVGVGAGFYPEEHEFIGIDFLDGAGRSERLGEAVQILDQALRGEHVTFSGKHFRLADAPMHPLPTQQPRPPLYVAAQGPKSLRTAAQQADAVVTLGELNAPLDKSLPKFRERMLRLDEICAELGRDPASLGRCYFSGWDAAPIFESDEATADFIGRCVEAGATEFSFTLYNPAQPAMSRGLETHRYADRDTLARVAQDVFPLFA
jgi:alkanesulfonate monooxygenase SsuD/methylene tetrahydromethanopterin reductase-like flavin-dependent oxidoreductase (luciferase family)